MFLKFKFLCKLKIDTLVVFLAVLLSLLKFLYIF